MITLIFIVFVLVAAFSFIEDNATDYKDIVYIGIMFLLICIKDFVLLDVIMTLFKL